MDATLLSCMYNKMHCLRQLRKISRRFADVLNLLRTLGFLANRAKCSLARQNVTYLCRVGPDYIKLSKVNIVFEDEGAHQHKPLKVVFSNVFVVP